MTSKAILQRQVYYLTDELERTGTYLQIERERRLDQERRLLDEFDKHVPDVNGARDIGMSALSRNRNVFPCAACSYYWPCPSWHMLRRVAGAGHAEYTLTLEKLNEQSSE